MKKVDITRYGYVRSTHDGHNNYKFDDIDEDLRLCDWAADVFPPFPPFDFVLGIVHMLDSEPVRLKDLVERVREYNCQWLESNNIGFDILDIPRQLLAGIEIGAISVVPMDKEPKAINCMGCGVVVLEDEIEGGWRGDLWYCVSCRRDEL